MVEKKKKKEWPQSGVGKKSGYKKVEEIFLGETDRFSFYLRGGFPDLYVYAKSENIADKYYVSSDWSDKFKGLVVDELRSCCPMFKQLIRDFDGITLVSAEGGMQYKDKAVFEIMRGYRTIIRPDYPSGGIAEVCYLNELLWSEIEEREFFSSMEELKEVE